MLMNVLYNVLNVLLVFQIPKMPAEVTGYIEQFFDYLVAGAGILANLKHKKNIQYIIKNIHKHFYNHVLPPPITSSYLLRIPFTKASVQRIPIIVLIIVTINSKPSGTIFTV